MVFSQEAAAAKTFNINSIHSSISFKVRHLVAQVRGEFTQFKGTIVLDEDHLENSKVTAVIDADSINTNDTQRDEHLKSSDFLNVASYPEILFISKSIKDNQITGDLIMHGVTKSVTLNFEYHGTQEDQWHNLRAGFSASGVIDRRDFGITFNQTLDQGGVVIGDEIKIDIEIEGALAASSE
ncbi:MAG: polyisoprenoid-binding protein [Candidatus Omnitrophica bacterium CG11_big_fil_rev_8_21_14_0_20_45_26]|uniref:Polyisoprenoid-binding protein n=1 Tax=Candidatus Abzuiibacterium crystallinum TaxID=1974748 RepID=A0A2H0LTH5_9BACT|nr:MAG: polyisoprenoid-binding protein [Candidatus Omnitrophica bacterium CG11_big_fil_rev_8_21_14_0_20_45_26]PIW65586.1 MAG: polyisoprenoid-binding protein [Candidatus Omnitrophica bacterium CG12_big_fil_rev_8_21_14_0_65_45_16]